LVVLIHSHYNNDEAKRVTIETNVYKTNDYKTND